jgi:DNA-binding MurR/RpiR family transcriptional regulator
MSNSDIFSKIHLNYADFTKTERKVADVILRDPQKVLYMSITDLADACKVGDTSVFRFCKTLKFQGYQEFKMSLAQSITTDDEGVPILTGRITTDDTLEAVAQKVLTTTVNALNETYALISPDQVKKAVDYMVAAQHIYFFGVGASLITAMEAKNKFMRVTPKVDCTIDSHLQAMQASLMCPQDLAVAISYSGSTKDVIRLAQLCRKAGAKVICITRFAKSPLTSYSDLTLLCGANEGPLQGGSLSAKISQLYLLDVLYAEYFRRTFDVSKVNKEKTASAVLDKLY